MLDSLALHAHLRPRQLALADLALDRHWTYRDADASAAAIAQALADRGVGEGDRVAVLARNSVHTILLHFACARRGAMIVPLNWRLATAELKYLLDDCRPSLVLGDEALQEHELIGESLYRFCHEAPAALDASAASQDAERPSLLLYTSGTSGTPKGVLLSERNLQETGINFAVLTDVSSRSVFLCDAPMFHVIGLVTNVRPVLTHGGSALVASGFDARVTYERLSDPALGVTHYMGVPQMTAAMRALEGFDPAPLRRLTTLVTGGAPHAPANVREWLNEGVVVTNGYGMTEAGTVFNVPLDIEAGLAKAGSVGVASPRVQTRVVDEQGHDVDACQPGELLVRGDNVTRGYWENEAATTDAFTDDGWLRTGDIARCDEDGYFWMVDRRKDMYISGGENVYPAEVESAVYELQNISECAVVGTPDDRWGEVGHLFYATDDDMLTQQAILDFVAGRLARYKLPKHLTRVDALPRNGAGKIVKSALLEQSTKLLSS